ncbi:hypothetical protein FQN51_001282 [Onygenales sp. PD_10]|nr:hypothetical protein FQN51_001282 [Onygenales sp. PD_10]
MSSPGHPPASAPQPPASPVPPDQFPPPHQQPYGAPPPQGSPVHGAPPPQGSPVYGAPPPQGQYPQYGQYPPPQAPYPQQGQYPPPGQYPPQGQYPQQGPPPPGGYPSPQQGQFPPQQYPQYNQQYPQQGQYQYPQQPGYLYPQQPPPGGYNAPPPMQGYGAPPSHQMHGAPGMTGAPSPGYVPGQMAMVDVSMDAEKLKKAIDKDRKDPVIDVLAKADPLKIESLKESYKKSYYGRKDLVTDIETRFSGTFSEDFTRVASMVAKGPLRQDVDTLKRAMKGLGTNEMLLNDVLLHRSNADMNAIKTAYEAKHKVSLERDVRDEMSGSTKSFFSMILAAKRAEESSPIDPTKINEDALALYEAMKSKTDGPVLQIFAYRSYSQLLAISKRFNEIYSTKPLKTQIADFKSVPSDLRDALLVILAKVVDRPLRDAEDLEYCMAGAGTKDELLAERVVRIHWDHQRMQLAKAAFKNRYGKELTKRVEGETSRSYKRILVEILE